MLIEQNCCNSRLPITSRASLASIRNRQVGIRKGELVSVLYGSHTNFKGPLKTPGTFFLNRKYPAYKA